MRVHGEPGALDEGQGAGLAQRRERSLAGQEGAHARSIRSRNVGIDLERLLDRLDGRLRVVVHEERPPEQRDGGGRGFADEIAAVGQRPVIARRQQEIFAAHAAVRARRAEIDHPTEPEIVEQAERVRRRLDNHRPFGEIDIGEEVDGVGVGGQEQRARIHEPGKDQDALVVLHAGIPDALARRVDRDATKTVEEGGDAALEVELVVNLGGGRSIGNAVAEFERPDRGLDLIWRGERRRDRRIALRARRTGRRRQSE